MRLSVVVPVFNAERDISACLGSLVSQSYPQNDREIIVVDNGSSDSSAQIVRRYPGVRLVDEKRPGPYAARNRGVAESRGDVIAFIDPDCIAAPDWLENIAAAMSDPGTGLVQGCRRAASDSLPVRVLADYENAKAAYILGSGLGELYYGFTNNMAVRRELFEEVGPFVEVPRGGDTIFVRRVVKARSTDVVRYREDVVVTHGELDSVSGYFRKVFLYGRHRQLTRSIEAIRPLGMKERLAAFRLAVREGRYGLAKAALLAVLLAGGLFSWRLGSMSKG